MRTRTASLAFAIVAAVAIVAGPVAAGSSTPISITLDVNFDPGSEVITAQTNFCDGTAESATLDQRRRPARRWVPSCSTSARCSPARMAVTA